MITQDIFHAGLLNPDAPVPEGLQDGDARPTVKRYAVYRNNVTASLIDAMKTAFPLVFKLIGDENFRHLASLYVRAHPPTSPLIMFYGIEFPRFLENFEPLAHIGYLADASRLDLALRHSYHAADTTAFDATPLQSLSPDALLEAQVSLAPATRILRSRWPIFDIWQIKQNANAPKPQAIGQDILITRPEFDPMPHLLPPGTAEWLITLDAGTSFGEAHDHALNRCPEFDFTHSLTLALQTQAFAKISHKELI